MVDAATITDKLRLTLDVGGGGRIERPPTRTMEAYERYLQPKAGVSRLQYGLAPRPPGATQHMR